MKVIKFALTLSAFITLIIGVFYLQWVSKTDKNKNKNTPEQTLSDNVFGWKIPSSASVDNSSAFSQIRDSKGIPKGLPVRLKIPIIGVDSVIEDALITNDGRMDIPAGSVNVAWFSLGPYPGKVGSAVIGGHFGITKGVPFVFYNLDKLKVGDKVYIVDDKNDTLAFQVRSIKSFDRNADATAVFTSQDGKAHLNLITCEGVWNQVNDTYPDRLVVFTDAIPSEGAVEVKKEPQKVVKLPETAITSKNLYKIPIDGLVTSFLLISIVFIFFKILKKK